MLTDTET